MTDVMPRPTSSPSPAPEGGLAAEMFGGDWPVRATDTVERVVETVRSKTTGPAIVVSRVVVYGVVAAVLGVIAVVLLLASLVRLLDVYIPRGVWLPDLIVGVLLGLAGVLAWNRRQPRLRQDER